MGNQQPMLMLGDQQMEEDKAEVNNGAAFGSQGENIIGNAADQPDFEEPIRMRSNLSANSVPMRDTTNTFPQP